MVMPYRIPSIILWRILPLAGNPDGNSSIPKEAGLEEITVPDQVVGNGTPYSCTCDAVVNAVAKGERSYLTAARIQLPGTVAWGRIRSVDLLSDHFPDLTNLIGIEKSFP